MLKWIFATLLLANAGAAVVISLQTPHKVDLATYELNAQRVRLVGPDEVLQPETASPASTGTDTPAADASAAAPTAPETPAEAAAGKTAAAATAPTPLPPTTQSAALATTPAKPVPASHPAEPAAAHVAEAKAESRQVCLRLQHLDDASAQTLKTHFDKRKFRYRDLAEPVEARPGSKYWVYLPTSEGREAANQKSADLKARGFDNYVVSNDGAFRNALSLGLFSQESGARTLASKLAAAGIKGVQVQQRGAPAPRHTLRLARLSAQEADAVRQMARQAGSGIEVDEISCHK